MSCVVGEGHNMIVVEDVVVQKIMHTDGGISRYFVG